MRYTKLSIIFTSILLLTLSPYAIAQSSRGTGDLSHSVDGRDVIARREAAAVKTRAELAPANRTNLAPSNDMFDFAQEISGTDAAIGGTNLGATMELNEPIAGDNAKTVWYQWTAPANLSMTFETYGGRLSDTVIDIYMGGTIGSLKLLAGNDDITPDLNAHSRITLAVTAGTNYKIRLYGLNGTEGNFNLRWEINGAESWKQFNFDGAAGSRMSDYGVFRLQAGTWWIHESLTGNTLVQKWGVVTDYLVPGDYDGDGSNDFAVWRPAVEPRPTDPPPGFWILRSADNTFFMRAWGVPTDRPATGDYDGDDMMDMVLWRPSTGTFWMIRSTDGAAMSFQWGTVGDFTASGDYDGDGKTDFAVQRADGTQKVIWIVMSSDQSIVAIPFGLISDQFIPGDYDYDGKSDICVHRYTNDTFYWRRSSDGEMRAVKLGTWGNQLVAGDYSANFGSDITVWQPSAGNFYTYDPIDGTLSVFHWGQQGDAAIGRSAIR